MIVWGPPAEPNGEITGYQVKFIGTPSGNLTVFKAPTESYHVVSVNRTFQFQVTCFYGALYDAFYIMIYHSHTG